MRETKSESASHRESLRETREREGVRETQGSRSGGLTEAGWRAGVGRTRERAGVGGRGREESPLPLPFSVWPSAGGGEGGGSKAPPALGTRCLPCSLLALSLLPSLSAFIRSPCRSPTPTPESGHYPHPLFSVMKESNWSPDSLSPWPALLQRW